MKKLSKRITSIICSGVLSFTMILGCTAPSFAASKTLSVPEYSKESNESITKIYDSKDNEVIDIEPSILNNSIENSDEKQQVLNALKNSKIDAREALFTHEDVYTQSSFKGVKNKQDLSFGEPYKVVLFNEDIKDALNKGITIDTAIDNSPYYWEVPIINNKNKKVVSTCIVDKLENKWQVVEVGSNIDSNDINLLRNYQEISELMKNKNIENIKDFAHIRVLQIGYDIFYAKTDENEYFIPIKFEGNNNGKLKNKVSYSRESFVDAIKPLIEMKNQSNGAILLGK